MQLELLIEVGITPHLFNKLKGRWDRIYMKKPKESYKFYQNNQCEYFPCHKGVKNFNCKWCFCPLYEEDNCGGNYTILDNGIKDCSDCIIPHQGEQGYEHILNNLTGE